MLFCRVVDYPDCSVGSWKLKTLSLQNCTGITDTGVGKLAKCSGSLTVGNVDYMHLECMIHFRMHFCYILFSCSPLI